MEQHLHSILTGRYNNIIVTLSGHSMQSVSKIMGLPMFMSSFIVKPFICIEPMQTPFYLVSLPDFLSFEGHPLVTAE